MKRLFITLIMAFSCLILLGQDSEYGTRVRNNMYIVKGVDTIWIQQDGTYSHFYGSNPFYIHGQGTIDSLFVIDTAAFASVVTAPTASSSDSSNLLATTAFVKRNGGGGSSSGVTVDVADADKWYTNDGSDAYWSDSTSSSKTFTGTSRLLMGSGLEIYYDLDGYVKTRSKTTGSSSDLRLATGEAAPGAINSGDLYIYSGQAVQASGDVNIYTGLGIPKGSVYLGSNNSGVSYGTNVYGPTQSHGDSSALIATTAFTDRAVLRHGREYSSSVVVFDGDSRTVGFTTATTAFYPYPDQITLSGFTNYNTGLGGATLTDNTSDGERWIVDAAFSNVDNKYTIQGDHNIVVIWAGYNGMAVRDRSAEDTYDALVSYANSRRAKGWQVVVCTEASFYNSVGHSRRNAFNDYVRSTWTTFADGFVDLANNSLIGDSAAYSDATYFHDSVHMTNSGYDVVASLVGVEIQRLLAREETYINKELIVIGDPTTGTTGVQPILRLQRNLSDAESFEQIADFNLGRYTTPGGGYEARTRLDLALRSDAIASALYYADTTVMTWTNQGFVGINDTTPEYTLDVNGDIRLTGDLYAGSSLFALSNVAFLDANNDFIGTNSFKSVTIDGDISFYGGYSRQITFGPTGANGESIFIIAAPDLAGGTGGDLFLAGGSSIGTNGSVYLGAIASDNYYGGVYAATQAATDASQLVATTEFVQNAISVSGAPALLSSNNLWTGTNEFTNTFVVGNDIILDNGANRQIKIDGVNGESLDVIAGDDLAGGTGGSLYLAGGTGMGDNGDVYLASTSVAGYYGSAYARTPIFGDNSNKVATTEYVDRSTENYAYIHALLGSAAYIDIKDVANPDDLDDLLSSNNTWTGTNDFEGTFTVNNDIILDNGAGTNRKIYINGAAGEHLDIIAGDDLAGGTGGSLYLAGGISGLGTNGDVYLGATSAAGYYGNVYAQTKSAKDSSNNVATTQYVDKAVAIGGGSGTGVTEFISLTDVPGGYTGNSLDYVRVNSGETGLEFFDLMAGTNTFTGLNKFTNDSTIVDNTLIVGFSGAGLIRPKTFGGVSGLDLKISSGSEASAANAAGDLMLYAADAGGAVYLGSSNSGTNYSTNAYAKTQAIADNSNKLSTTNYADRSSSLVADSILAANNVFSGNNEFSASLLIDGNLLFDGGANREIKFGPTGASGESLTITASPDLAAATGGDLFLAGGTGMGGDGNVYLGAIASDNYYGDVYVKTQTDGDNSLKVANTKYVDIASAGASDSLLSAANTWTSLNTFTHDSTVVDNILIVGSSGVGLIRPKAFGGASGLDLKISSGSEASSLGLGGDLMLYAELGGAVYLGSSNNGSTYPTDAHAKTQTAADNSNKLATTNYADRSSSLVIDSLLAASNTFAGSNEFSSSITLSGDILFEGGSDRQIKFGPSGAAGEDIIIEAAPHLASGVPGNVFLSGGSSLAGYGDVYLGANSLSSYTGDVYAKTQAGGDNSLKVANTAFVHSEVYDAKSEASGYVQSLLGSAAYVDIKDLATPGDVNDLLASNNEWTGLNTFSNDSTIVDNILIVGSSGVGTIRPKAFGGVSGLDLKISSGSEASSLGLGGDLMLYAELGGAVYLGSSNNGSTYATDAYAKTQTPGDNSDKLATTAYVAAATSGAVTNFTGLGDTPSAYTGNGLNIVRVNSGASALEFVDLLSATNTWDGVNTFEGTFTVDNDIILGNGAGTNRKIYINGADGENLDVIAGDNLAGGTGGDLHLAGGPSGTGTDGNVYLGSTSVAGYYGNVYVKTQTDGDNSTKVANTLYVDRASAGAADSIVAANNTFSGSNTFSASLTVNEIAFESGTAGQITFVPAAAIGENLLITAAPHLASGAGGDIFLAGGTSSGTNGNVYLGAIASDNFYGNVYALTQAINDNSTKVATTEYVDRAISGTSSLPTQTGNNGTLLTTDGTDASWTDIISTGKIVADDVNLFFGSDSDYGIVWDATQTSFIIGDLNRSRLTMNGTSSRIVAPAGNNYIDLDDSDYKLVFSTGTKVEVDISTFKIINNDLRIYSDSAGTSQTFYVAEASGNVLSSGSISANGEMTAGTGFTAGGSAGLTTSFDDNAGRTVTVTGGIITAITSPSEPAPSPDPAVLGFTPEQMKEFGLIILSILIILLFIKVDSNSKRITRLEDRIKQQNS